MMITEPKLWQIFTKKDNNIATCRKCFKVIKYSGSTMTLYKHLSSVDCAKADKRNLEPSKNIEAPTTTTRTTENDIHPCTSKELDTNTSNVIEIKQTLDPHPVAAEKVKGLKKNKITMALLYFICKDVRPFSIIEGEGFINLMKEVAPSYKVPSATYIEKNLKITYQNTSHLFKEKLTNAVDLCLTIKTETMAAKQFMGLTVHFFEGTNIFNRNIGVKEINSSHTARYIADELQLILNNWNISIPKIRCIVSDGGANIEAGVKLIDGNINHLPCSAYLMKLVMWVIVKDAVIKELINKVQHIIKYISNSVNNSDKLQNGTPGKSVMKKNLDVSTNSLSRTIEVFLKMIKIGTVPLSDNNINNSSSTINSQELEVLKQLILLLKPIEFVNKELSRENYISSIIPMLNCLVVQINLVQSDHNTIINIKKNILNKISELFGCIESKEHYAIATLLDPRFKLLHFKNDRTSGTAVQMLKYIIKEPISVSDSNNSDDSENEMSEKEYDFWEKHKQLAREQKKKTKIRDADEISTYLSSPVSSLKNKPLEEWEEMKTVFPLLYQQARKFLVVVATPDPCQQLFSKVGAIMNENHNRLSSKHLDKLFFLDGATFEEFYG